MSRIGKKPVIIPANVTVEIAEGNNVTVKGPKGTLTYAFHPDMILKMDGNVLTVERPDEEHLHKSLHGLTRTLLNNMVVGVEKGFSKELFIGTLNSGHIAFDLQDHVGVEGVGQGALGALHGDDVAFSNFDSDVCRNNNRLLTNSRHTAFLLTKRKPGLRRRCAAREPSCRS